MMRWFNIWWYKYLFSKSDCKLRAMFCRIMNHPAGVWWHNPRGIEPDMHCKNCGDDLG